MRVVQFGAFVAATYAAIITAMYIAQTWLLFPTTLAGLARVQLPASAQRIEIRTPDRETLVGVRIPPIGEPGGPVPTLVGFGGSAWNAEAMAVSLHSFRITRWLHSTTAGTGRVAGARRQTRCWPIRL